MPGDRITSVTTVSGDAVQWSTASLSPTSAGSADTVGGAASYLIVMWPVAMLAALSRQSALRSAAASAGPAYRTVSQLSNPDVASLAVKAIVTGRFHQPS